MRINQFVPWAHHKHLVPAGKLNFVPQYLPVFADIFHKVSGKITASRKFTPSTLYGHTCLSDRMVTVNDGKKPLPQAQMLQNESNFARRTCLNGDARG